MAVRTSTSQLGVLTGSSGTAGTVRVDEGGLEERDAPSALSPRRVVLLAGLWSVVALVVVALVFVGVGPMLEQRDQRALLRSYRTQVDHSANEASGLAGVSQPTKAPAPGAPVAILEVGRLRLQQVVVEGVAPQQTRRAPGHVPGTAGLGQPGNSAVVGRRGGFGAVFGALRRLRAGDRILVTTTQGQSVYSVVSRRTVALTAPRDTTSADGQAPAASSAKAAKVVPLGSSASIDDVYGPTTADQLTLVTSASAWPWSTGRAVVVQAQLVGRPFTPTPQNGRSDGADGRGVDGSAWTFVLLAVLGLAAAVGFSVLLHRRLPFRSAYLLAAPLLVVFALLFGEAVLLLVPAWA